MQIPQLGYGRMLEPHATIIRDGADLTGGLNGRVIAGEGL